MNEKKLNTYKSALISALFLFINSSYAGALDNIVNKANKQNKSKIKIKWLTKKKLLEKIYPYKSIKSWKPRKSNITDVINVIKNT